MKKALRILILFATCFIIKYANAATTVPAGTLASAHWTLAGSPYNIMGHIIVANNDSLVIDPGVVIEFQGKYKLFCNGKIIANGTSSQPILFTIATALRSTGWLGIRYDNTPVTNGQSSFKYCTIEYGRADITGDDQGGGIYFNNFGNCIISNSVIRNCYAQNGGGAIAANKASPTIVQDTFYNNSNYSGGGGLQFTYSSATIDGCQFKDAGVYCLYSSLIISNNNFIKCINSGGVSSFSNPSTGYLVISHNVFDSCAQMNGGGGGAILLSNAQAKIEHNIFKRNTSICAGGAISCWTQISSSNSSNIIISNNLFYGNKSGIYNGAGAPFGGGAISFSNCSGKVINNTIANNYSDTTGGAIICFDRSSPSFYNNIIFDNKTKTGIENIFVLDNLSDPNFYNNDLEGGYAGINTNGTPLVGANVKNIDSIPHFTNPAAGIYTLMASSACIDSGTTSGISSLIPAVDLAGNPRIGSPAIDMGAYESAGKTSIKIDAKSNAAVAVYPNPTEHYFEISGLTLSNIQSIQVWDMLGKQVAFFDHIVSNRFDVSNLLSGALILKINCKDESVKIVRMLKN